MLNRELVDTTTRFSLAPPQRRGPAAKRLSRKSPMPAILTDLPANRHGSFVRKLDRPINVKIFPCAAFNLTKEQRTAAPLGRRTVVGNSWPLVAAARDVSRRVWTFDET